MAEEVISIEFQGDASSVQSAAGSAAAALSSVGQSGSSASAGLQLSSQGAAQAAEGLNRARDAAVTLMQSMAAAGNSGAPAFAQLKAQVAGIDAELAKVQGAGNSAAAGFNAAGNGASVSSARIGQLTSVVGSTISAFSGSSGALGSFGSELTRVGSTASQAVSAVGGVGSAAAGVVGPLAAAGAAVAVLAGGLIGLGKAGADSMRDMVKGAAEFKMSIQDFDKFSTMLKVAGTNTQALTGVNEKLQKAVTELNGGFSGGAQSIGEYAKKQNELVASGQKTAEQAQRAVAVYSQQIRASTDMTKALSPEAQALKALGITQADVADKGNDMMKVWQMVFQRLNEMPESTKKAKIEQDLFGNSYKEVALLVEKYNEVQARTDELLKDIPMNYKDAKDQALEYSAAQEAMNRMMKEIASEVGPSYIRLLMDMAKAAEPIVTGIAKVIEALLKLRDAIKELSGGSINLGFGNLMTGAIAGGGGMSLGGFASGTRYAPGGLTMVGEQGPELVNLPMGSQVWNNNDTTQMMMGGNTTYNISFPGAMVANRYDFENMVQTAITSLRRQGRG